VPRFVADNQAVVSDLSAAPLCGIWYTKEGMGVVASNRASPASMRVRVDLGRVGATLVLGDVGDGDVGKEPVAHLGVAHPLRDWP